MTHTRPLSAAWLRIAQRWGDSLLDVRHVQRRDRPITIGGGHAATARVLGLPRSRLPDRLAAFVPQLAAGPLSGLATPAADFTVDEDAVPPGEERALVRPVPEGWALTIEPAWTLRATLDGAPIDEEGLRARGWLASSGALRTLVLHDGLDVAVDVGPTTFEASLVDPDRVALPGAAVRLSHLLVAEAVFLGLLGLLAFVGLLAAVLVAMLPGSPDSGAFVLDDRFTHLIAERVERVETDKSGGTDQESGERAPEAEGRRGEPDARQEVARGQTRSSSAPSDREIAEQAGLMGALASAGDPSGDAVSADLLDGIGGLIGKKGAQIGSRGLGARGEGLGGGGSIDGIGGLDMGGRGPGDGRYGPGGDLGAKREGTLSTPSREMLMIGSLDRAQIDEVVKNHLNQVRYCYQRELVRSPSMGGKLAVRFTIAGDGTVSKAAIHKSQLGNPTVEGCIVGRFLRMRFPEPRGGGIVVVTYPFVFSGG